MTNEFTNIMEKRSDAELIEILTKYRNDYQPDAIIACENEFAKRNLTLEQVETVKRVIEMKDKNNAEKANAPLDVHWKVLTCVFPGFLNIIVGGTFKADGYDRKFKELIRWTLYGVGIYIGLIIFMMILISLLH